MSTMLAAKVDKATSFTMFIVPILLLIPSPLGAAPNSLGIIQVWNFLSMTDMCTF